MHNKAQPASMPDEERRASRRHRSATTATVRRQKQPNDTVEVLDISATGCRLRSKCHLVIGSRVWLGLPGIETWAATVVWFEDGEGGLSFDRPLHPMVAERYASRTSGSEAEVTGTFQLPIRLSAMTIPGRMRKHAEECRLLAAHADGRTAHSLLILASDFEVEADRIERSWKPGGDA